MNVIEVNSLSKKYTLDKALNKGENLREKITHLIADLAKIKTRQSSKDFFALENVSFNVQKGEIVGIIGPNGAGKSTLLKILSKITMPSVGEVKIKGRITSLLEVGTGFHPELTGRENIYLNGSILGMYRSEIDKKIDEIIDFSGVKKFIDMPVKKYSSGMTVRLAFSVASHLNVEIIVIDEVLAVGDNEFQRKCAQKIKEITKDSDRTILMVSHNMSSINQLCNRCIYLKEGRLISDGDPEMVVGQYIENKKQFSQYQIQENVYSDEDIDILKIYITDNENIVINKIDYQNFLELCVKYNIKSEIKNFRIGLQLKTEMGDVVFVTFVNDMIKDFEGLVGEHLIKCRIPGNVLNINKYFFSLVLERKDRVKSVYLEDIIAVDIVDKKNIKYKRIGVLAPNIIWTEKN